MKRKILFLVLIVALLVGAPAIAQDETPTGEFATNTPVVEPIETPAPVEEPAPEPPPVEPGFNLREFLVGALIGAATTLTAVFGIVGRLKNDKAALDAIEWLGRSIPVEALDKLNELGRNLRDAGEVLDRVTDGKPNEPAAG